MKLLVALLDLIWIGYWLGRIRPIRRARIWARDRRRHGATRPTRRTEQQGGIPTDPYKRGI